MPSEQKKTPGELAWGFTFVGSLSVAYLLSDWFRMVLITLRLFVPHVAGFAPFRIFRVPTLGKVLLSCDSKCEFLVALAANQNPRLKPTFHRVPPLCSDQVHLT